MSNGASGSREWKHMDKETAGRQDQKDDGGVSFLSLPLPRPEGRYRNSKLGVGGEGGCLKKGKDPLALSPRP